MPGNAASAGQSSADSGFAGFLVAGDERDGGGELAVGHRDAGVGGSGDARGDARHDLERDAGLQAHERLLAAAAEHERVTALQPHHVPPGPRVVEQQPVGLRLRHLLAAALLADVVQLGVGARAGERLGRDQPVVQDHVRARDQLRGAHGQQAGVARPRADQVDRAGRQATASARASRSAAPADSIRPASRSAASSAAGSSSISHSEPSGSPTNARTALPSARTPIAV